MEALRVWACLIVLASIAASVPLAAGKGDPQVTDAPDDARENDSSSSADLARRTACRAGGVLTAATGQCGSGGATAPAAGGDPAPPTMEAISATLWDDPDALHVEMELKTVDEKFPGAVRLDGSAGTLYTVCWTTSEATCTESVVLAAMPSAGDVGLTAIFRVDTDGCNDYGRCVWRVPYTLQPGSPGRIQWDVPRDLLPNGTQSTVLVQPMLKVTRYLSPSNRIVWPMEDGVGYVVRGPEGAATAGYAANHYVPVDDSQPGTDVTLATTPSAPRLDATFDALTDAKGDVVGGTRADLDILALTLAETDTDLTLSVQLSAVDTRSRDHDLLGGFDLAGGRYVQWGYAARGGLLSPYAEVCVAPGCFLDAAPATRSVPVNVTVEPGAPGWIRATFHRADVGAPKAGDMVGSIDVTVFTYDDRTTQALSTDVAAAQTFVSGQTDTLAYAPPWRFQLDTRRTMSTSGVFLEDDIGDAKPPSGMENAKDRFDVAYVEAMGAAPRLSRVTLGISDLSSIEVPAGWRGFVYAVSLETEKGQFMVGFLRTASGTATTQEFFCGEDVVLFTPAPRDPDDIIRTAITGLISRQPGVSAGASARGALVFEVPHDCFGEVGEEPVHVKRLAAGTFLLPLTSAGPVKPTAVDVVERDEPFTLHAASVAAPAPAWYAEPFGIQSFWDIAGMAGAVGASILGVFAVRRKRSLLKKYLQRIDAIALQEDASPGTQEKALLALRHEVKEALILSKLDHSHYVVIDHRLDEALGKARVKSLAAAFDDLPARMLKRLQDLLVDGQMSREDYRVFCMLLDESSLTDDAKARVRRRLEAWVRQDAADAARETRAEA